jgi:hypothetical protein
MFIAEPKVILRRRPHYDGEYIHRLHRNYSQIAQEFPHLIVIKTDSFNHVTATIAQYVSQAVATAQHTKMKNIGFSARRTLE